MSTKQGPAVTEVLLNLECPHCLNSLTLAPSAPLTFRCPEGHIVTLEYLRSLRKSHVDRSLEDLVQGWAQKYAVLCRIVRDAHAKGYNLIAQDALEQMNRLREKARQVSAHLPASLEGDSCLK
jgi:hypothetical protein